MTPVTRFDNTFCLRLYLINATRFSSKNWYMTHANSFSDTITHTDGTTCDTSALFGHLYVAFTGSCRSGERRACNSRFRPICCDAQAIMCANQQTRVIFRSDDAHKKKFGVVAFNASQRSHMPNFSSIGRCNAEKSLF